MYLKKVDGPRAVTLPDGRILTRADLPPAETRRWVVSRKVVVVRAVAHGLLSREEALGRYDLSAEEFESWVAALADGGTRALRATVKREQSVGIDNHKRKT